MKWFKWTSVAGGAVMGVLAVAGVAAVPSAPVQALSSACQIGNDTDVAVAWVADSTIEMPACQSGAGSRVRIDYRIRNLDPQQPLYVMLTAPDGSQHGLQNGTIPGTVDFARTMRWTTSSTSSKGTWRLNVVSLGPGAIVDSWKVWVIPGSCWRVSYDDVTATNGDWELVYYAGAYQPQWFPGVPASTSVTSACTHRASSDMRIEARLRNVTDNQFGGLQYGLRLFRNGVEIPMTIASQTVFGVDGGGSHVDVVLNADGSQMSAAGTWTLQVSVPDGGFSNVTLDQWVLHTSY